MEPLRILPPQKMRQITKHFKDREWRLNNLYQIINKQGEKILFNFNWAQNQLYKNLWYCNVILKARQLGMSTFIVLLFLDTCIFNSNCSAAIVAHTREDAEHLFRKAKFAYDNLPDEFKSCITVNTDNARELIFSNGSSFRVGVSLRSATVQYLHISEFGKICAKYPDKAREIVTGSLNTLAKGQFVFIESTAEGREGYFYEICKEAMRMEKLDLPLTQIDFRFHFFPWYRDALSQLNEYVWIPSDLQEYFAQLEAQNIYLSESQKFWYAKKRIIQGEDMLREYPSTPEEAFLASTEALYYGYQINLAREEKRIGHVPHDAALPCYTAWDLGFNDSTAIWIYQLIGQEIHLIEYIEDSGKALSHYFEELKRRPYAYEKHFVPHDAAATELGTGLSRVETAKNFGFQFTVAKRLPIIEGIDAVRHIFNRCWFDEKKCDQGLKALENYKKEWDDRHGCWKNSPLHNFASHGADAFRILATTLKLASHQSMTQEDVDRIRNEAYMTDHHLPHFFRSSNHFGD